MLRLRSCITQEIITKSSYYQRNQLSSSLSTLIHHHQSYTSPISSQNNYNYHNHQRMICCTLSSTSSPSSFHNNSYKHMKPSKLPRWQPHKSLNIEPAVSKVLSSPSIASQKVAIVENIITGRHHNNPDLILSSISLARQQHIVLDPEIYMHGLWAASIVDNDKAKEAFLIFDAISSYVNGDTSYMIPIEAFPLVLSVCARYGNARAALDIISKHDKLGYQYTEPSLRHFLLSLIGAGDKFLLGKIRFYYREYYKMVHYHHWTANQSLLEEVAIAMSYGEGKGHDTISIIRNYTDCGYEPSYMLCCSLMTGSMMAQETAVLRVMITWCLDNFVKHHRVDDGMLHQMTHVAVHKTDDDLSKLIIKLVQAYHHHDHHQDHQQDGMMVHDNVRVPVWYYYTWILSSIRKDNSVGMIEALVETMNQGYDLYSISSSSPSSSSSSSSSVDEHDDSMISSYGEVVRDRIVECLSTRIIFQDELYTSLVDLVRHDYIAPKVMLEALMIASARSGKQDRVFATFQEYTSLFMIQPDIHTYNALLLSSSYRMMNLDTLFDILQQMEGKGIAPNRMTYSILFDKMIDIDDFHDYFMILEHMRSSTSTSHHHIYPYPRTIRKLAIAFAVSHDYEPMREALWMLSCEMRCQITLDLISSSSSSSSSDDDDHHQDDKELQQKKDDINYLLPDYGIPDFLIHRICNASGDKLHTMAMLRGKSSSPSIATETLTSSSTV